MRGARLGLWALPAYSVLLGLSTLTAQPSIDDFDAYARYTTTGTFLLGHLGASIFGAALAILGSAAVTAYLAPSRTAIAGLVLTTTSNVFLAASFGSAAFVQPGLGRAHLAGVPGMAELNGDTAYGPALVATALSASALLVVAAVVTGTALTCSRPCLRIVCIAYATLLPLFVVAGFVAHPVQPVAGFVLALATTVLALRMPHAVDRRRASPARLQ